MNTDTLRAEKLDIVVFIWKVVNERYICINQRTVVQTGLLIKLDNMGVLDRVYNLLKDFLFGRFIQICVGKISS